MVEMKHERVAAVLGHHQHGLAGTLIEEKQLLPGYAMPHRALVFAIQKIVDMLFCRRDGLFKIPILANLVGVQIAAGPDYSVHKKIHGLPACLRSMRMDRIERIEGLKV